MLNFVLTAFLTTSWLVSFKALDKFGINTFQTTLVNYWVCVLTGLISFGLGTLSNEFIYSGTLWAFAIYLGSLFIGTFLLIAYTSQRLSVTLATLASKVSLVIPVIFSLWYLEQARERFDFFNGLGVLLSIAAIFLTSSAPQSSGETTSKGSLLLPLGVFLLTGLIDSTLNYLNHQWIPQGADASFIMMTFACSAMAGTILFLYQYQVNQQGFQLASIPAGILIGIPNFFSLYFLIQALSDFDNNGARLFPMMNVSIIILSTISAYLFYKEKITLPKALGIGLALLALLLITYQEYL